jgi:predicted phosphodiesterase
MRLGLIGDVHGNALALEAVLRELEEKPVDEIVCLGDIAVGPQPVEAVRRIRDLGCRTIMGNWDAYFVHGFPEPTGELDARLLELGAWWASQLSAGELEELGPAVELSLGDGVDLLAFHGSPRSFEEEILPTTPDAELETMLAGRRAPLMAFGHTHFQMVRRHGNAMLVNPGSVGLPFARPEPVMRICPWAEYGIVAVEEGRLSVELHRTRFDVEAFLEIQRTSGMPYGDWWPDLWASEPSAAHGENLVRPGLLPAPVRDL